MNSAGRCSARAAGVGYHRNFEQIRQFGRRRLVAHLHSAWVSAVYSASARATKKRKSMAGAAGQPRRRCKLSHLLTRIRFLETGYRRPPVKKSVILGAVLLVFTNTAYATEGRYHRRIQQIHCFSGDARRILAEKSGTDAKSRALPPLRN